MTEARLYDKLSNKRLRCNLCAHRCVIADGKSGVCEVRNNRDGMLYTLAYGRTVAEQVDPVEKKPLFHFYPGARAYSIATAGCNFRCRWCQNWEISQIAEGRQSERGSSSTAGQIVDSAREQRCRMIAYTYTEPTIFYEYAYDTAVLAHSSGLANIFVTNGYMTEEMLQAIRPYLDAVNVDLKAFKDETYRRYVGARLQPVLDSLKTIRRLGIWLEVTTLVIPGINDDQAELRDAARFVKNELGAETPWHISRFFPAYKMTDLMPTPVATLRRAREIGLEEGLRYVYQGNISEPGSQDTLCPACGHLLIRRSRFSLLENRLKEGRCPDCGAPISGIGMG